MNHVFVNLLGALASILIVAFLAVILRFFARRGRYPLLAEPDPDCVDTPRDRRRYYLANFLALGVGALGALALWAVPPIEHGAAGDVLWSLSLYEHRAGRLIGPFFFMLGAGGLFLPRIARWLVGEGPLLHILRRSSKTQFMGTLDPTPLLVWLCTIISVLSLFMHFGIRMQHLTFDRAGVRYQDWPWQSEVAHDWSQVQDIRIVAKFEAMIGSKVVDRPYLVLEFKDGDTIRGGRRQVLPDSTWLEAAKIASTRSGVAVRRVERD